MAAERLAAAVAAAAGIGPDLARPPQAAQSLRTGTSSGTVTPSKASRGDRCSSADSSRVVIVFGRRRDEARAHALDRGVQRRKIDRDFVVEPAVRPRERHRQHAPRGASVITRANRVIPHRLQYDRFALAACQGARRVLASRSSPWSHENVPSAANACACRRASRPIACPARARQKPNR